MILNTTRDGQPNCWSTGSYLLSHQGLLRLSNSSRDPKIGILLFSVRSVDSYYVSLYYIYLYERSEGGVRGTCNPLSRGSPVTPPIACARTGRQRG